MYFTNLSIKKKLGIIIKNYRRNYKLTQDELAKDINCCQSVISRIELGSEIIDIELYNLALNRFNIFFIDNKENEKIIKKLFKEVYYGFEFVDENKLINLDKRIFDLLNNNKDIINYFEYMILLAFYLFHNHDYKKCTELLEEINPNIYVCDFEFQFFYLLIKFNLEVFNSDFINGKETLQNIMGNEYTDKQFLSYFLGWYYFKSNNRAMSLKYLIYSLKKFTETNNYKRIFRVETMISSLLIKERNFFLGIKRCNSLLSSYGKYLNSKETFIIYFLIGYCHYLTENYNESIIYFNKSLDIDDNLDKNHIYYYLLNIYDKLDDVKQYRLILNKIDNDDENGFGYKIINLYLQSRIGKSIKYYEYIDNNIVPLIPLHYEKMEISSYVLELLNYYYDTQQYTKYYELSQKILKFFA